MRRGSKDELSLSSYSMSIAQWYEGTLGASWLGVQDKAFDIRTLKVWSMGPALAYANYVKILPVVYYNEDLNQSLIL